MIDQIVFTASSDRIVEGSRLNITASFRDSVTRLAATPTTVEWGLRDPDCPREIQPLTSVTPGTSVTLVTTGTQNTLQTNVTPRRVPSVRREVTVVVDRGLSGQYVATYTYTVTNVGAINP